MYYGKYRGVVTDNMDPMRLGRIKARVPDVFGIQESGWAMPCVPYAGRGSGVYLVPELDAGVWIEFEAGDLTRPIWSGCWWSDGSVPGTAAPAVKIIRSDTGLTLALDDATHTLSLSDADGSNCIRIEARGGQVTIKATAKVLVEAPQVEWTAAASQPVVLGEVLLQYLNQLVAAFNSHLHPGQRAGGFIPVTPAPPVPVQAPATAALVSQKVKTG